MIERPMPGAASLPQAQLEGAVAHSEDVLTQMRGEGKKIKQVRSFVAGDTIFCVYNADSEEMVREHAQRAGLPCATVTKIAHEVQHDTSTK
ncbi:MAG: DUF4242 domain-containing protein [Acidobacteria bacterium]|nr:DUF4242 domain-containing protein [Acidobacteriota bacterium]